MIVWLWIGFIAFVLIMLALDLGVFNRKAHVITTGEAMRWTGLCVGLALCFMGVVYFLYDRQIAGLGTNPVEPLTGKDAAVKFLTAYIVEQSLSLDNIFVIAVIFGYFCVPPIHQHRVLFWGILGALVMRGIMIIAGTALIRRFEWIIYIFGALLVITAVKLFFQKDEGVHPDRNPLVRLARKIFPVCPEFQGERFFTRMNGKFAVTPLFLVLLVIESTDLLFAVDSIPACFAITSDPFLVFTSNIFAILCLRSLFFALAGMMDKFKYIKTSLVFILAYVGVKMLLTHHYKIPAAVSLCVLGGALAAGIVASLLAARKVDNARAS